MRILKITHDNLLHEIHIKWENITRVNKAINTRIKFCFKLIYIIKDIFK